MACMTLDAMTPEAVIWVQNNRSRNVNRVYFFEKGKTAASREVLAYLNPPIIKAAVLLDTAFKCGIRAVPYHDSCLLLTLRRLGPREHAGALGEADRGRGAERAHPHAMQPAEPGDVARGTCTDGRGATVRWHPIFLLGLAADCRWCQ